MGRNHNTRSVPHPPGQAPSVTGSARGSLYSRARRWTIASPSSLVEQRLSVPESPYLAWRVQALSRIINAGSYAVRPPSSSEGSSSSRATTPPAFRRLKHRSAPPADSRDAGRARDDGRGWTLAPDPDPSPGAASLLARRSDDTEASSTRSRCFGRSDRRALRSGSAAPTSRRSSTGDRGSTSYRGGEESAQRWAGVGRGRPAQAKPIDLPGLERLGASREDRSAGGADGDRGPVHRSSLMTAVHTP